MRKSAVDFLSLLIKMDIFLIRTYWKDGSLATSIMISMSPHEQPPVVQPPVAGGGIGTDEVKGQPVVKTIGAAGGSITSDDGSAVLNFPAGAIAVNTVVSLQRITNTGPNGLGDVHCILPQNLPLRKKISLCWTYNKFSLRGANTNGLLITYQGNGKLWTGTSDVNVNEVTKTFCFNSIDKLEYCDWDFAGRFCMKGNATDTVLIFTPKRPVCRWEMHTGIHYQRKRYTVLRTLFRNIRYFGWCLCKTKS